MMQKVKVNRFSSESPEYLYSNYLTSYASQFVLNQLSLMLKVNPVDQDNGEYTIETSKGYRTVTSNNCECIFYKSMLLPCRHIFALRKKLDLPLYDPSPCNKRWTFAYYQSTHRIFSREIQATSDQDPLLVTCASKGHCNKLSKHQKFRQASVITGQLASVASYASNVHFQRRIKLLEDLVDSWKDGKEVALTEVDEGNYMQYYKGKA